MKLKKNIAIISLVFAMILTCCSLLGCDNKSSNDNKLSIVVTIFPEYDWVWQILGEQIEETELTLLLDNSTDLHNYQPTANDIVTIANCDMFIYVGSESDAWVADVLAQATNKDMVVINLFTLLGDAVKKEEIGGGMEHEEDHEGEEEDAHINEDDEHVWLSLLNAKIICKEIAEKLWR